jgi:hypothetical protein
MNKTDKSTYAIQNRITSDGRQIIFTYIQY